MNAYNDKTNGSQRISHQASADTLLILAAMEKLGEGEVLTYDEMSKLVGYDVRAKRAPIEGAKRKMMSLHRAVMEPVRGIGMKRCCDEEKVVAGANGVRSIRRKARRSAAKIAAADVTNLPAEAKIRANSSLSILAMVASMTSSQTVKNVENLTKSADARLDLGAVAKMMKS